MTGPVEWQVAIFIVSLIVAVFFGGLLFARWVYLMVDGIRDLITKARHDMRSEFQIFVSESEDRIHRQLDYLRSRIDRVVNGAKRKDKDDGSS